MYSQSTLGNFWVGVNEMDTNLWTCAVEGVLSSIFLKL
jgi:hypothetical protein